MSKWLDIEAAKIGYNTVKDFKKIFSGLAVDGLENRSDRLISALNRYTRGVELEFEKRRLTQDFGSESLVVSKAEHDRVLEQLKRYSGE